METNYSPENNEQKWYDKTWVVVILCIFFFPVGLYALWKNSSIKKGWKVAITIFFGLVVIAQFNENKDTKIDNNKTTNDSTETIDSNVPKATRTDTLKEQLVREIKSLDKPFDSKNYRGTVEGLQMEVVLFSVWANFISEGETNKDKEVNKLSIELKKKVIALQIKEFPKMRSNYGKAVADKLWENNIYVSTQGGKSEVINLTGGVFANNKNIKDTQQTLLEVLTQFRFKEVRYRWYKDASEFTYYKVEAPKDNEIKPIDKQ
jgi:hypothetical protein